MNPQPPPRDSRIHRIPAEIAQSEAPHANCRTLHDATPELGYNAAIEDAEARMARGETQIVCPFCVRHVWDSFFHHLPGRPRYAQISRRSVLCLGAELPEPNPKYKPGQ